MDTKAQISADINLNMINYKVIEPPRGSIKWSYDHIGVPEGWRGGQRGVG